MKVRKEARRFIRKYQLQKTGVTIKSVTDIALSMGYDVIYFNPTVKRHMELLRSFGFDAVSPATQAFTCEKDGKKIIFIIVFSTDSDKLYLLLHELAHLHLNHFYASGTTEPEKEIQANDFASYVMRTKHTKRVFTYTIASVAVAALLFGNMMIYNTYRQSEHTKARLSEVVITKTGDKYHMPDCYHIIGRKTVSLNITEALALGYKACKSCRPEN